MHDFIHGILLNPVYWGFYMVFSVFFVAVYLRCSTYRTKRNLRKGR